MNVSFDPSYIQSCMSLWRKSLSNAIPMATEFQLHFIQERPAILRRIENTASAWLMILEHGDPAETSNSELVSLIGEIKTFQSWAKSELVEVEKLELQAGIEAGLDELLLQDPSLAARLRQMFKLGKPGQG